MRNKLEKGCKRTLFILAGLVHFLSQLHFQVEYDMPSLMAHSHHSLTDKFSETKLLVRTHTHYTHTYCSERNDH